MKKSCTTKHSSRTKVRHNTKMSPQKMKVNDIDAVICYVQF